VSAVASARAIESRGDTRETILVAALRIFAAKGYDAASTRAIATEAGINHGLIRYYFGSKSQLWKDAVDRAFAALESGLDAIAADPGISSDRERAGLLIRNYVRFVARNPEFVHLMHEEGKRPGPRMRWLVDRHVKRLFEGITALLGAADGRGVLRVDLPPIHLHYIIAGAVGLFFHQAAECKRLSGIDPFAEETVETHARAVEALLLGPAIDTEIPPHQEKST
jgi:AcrR family transcriptional regulator